MQRLAQRVQDRRSWLRLSKDKAAELAGMSPVTWTRVEDGLTVRALTYAGVEVVLGWPARSIKEYLRTGDDSSLPVEGQPERAAAATSEDRPTTLGALLDELDDPVQVLRILGEQLEDLGPDVFWATLGRIWRYHTTQSAGDGDSRQVG